MDISHLPESNSTVTALDRASELIVSRLPLAPAGCLYSRSH